MRKLLLSISLACLLASGCGENKPKIINSVQDAAAKKAESVENFAKDRLNVKD